MKLEIEGTRFTITLSQRNLWAMLTKLDDKNSACEITSNRVFIDGQPVLDKFLIFKGEADAVHYKDRHPPGSMSDTTERDISNAPR